MNKKWGIMSTHETIELTHVYRFCDRHTVLSIQHWGLYNRLVVRKKYVLVVSNNKAYCNKLLSILTIYYYHKAFYFRTGFQEFLYTSW